MKKNALAVKDSEVKKAASVQQALLPRITKWMKF